MCPERASGVYRSPAAEGHVTNSTTGGLGLRELWAQMRSWPRRRRVRVGLGLVYAGVACFWLLDLAGLSLLHRFTVGDNANLLEARSWLRGRLDLIIDQAALSRPNNTGRPWDTALFQGRVYSHFPPLGTMVFVPMAWLWNDEAPRWVLLVLLGLVTPALAYRVLLVCTPSVRTAILMTFALLFGSSLTFVVDRSVRWAMVFHTNQALSTLGLLLFLGEYFGQRRVWLAAIGLALSFWSRQLTLAYAVPLIYMAWRWPSRTARPADEPVPTDEGEPAFRPNLANAHRWQRLAVATLACAAMVGCAMMLNSAKFQNPLDSGYRHIYAGRDDGFARDAATYGIFSPHYFGQNLFWLFVGPPQSLQVGGLFLRRVENGSLMGRWESGYQPRLRRAQFAYLRANTLCTGLIWSTPLVCYLLFDLRRIRRDPSRCVLLVAAAVVLAAQLCYHSVGQDQRGYNRYSMDYLSPLLAILSPFALHGRRKWITPVLIGWSLLYFQWLVPQVSNF